METLLFSLIVLTLGILIVVVAMLVRTISKLNALEEAGLRQVETGIRQATDMVLPRNMQERFEQILTKHEQYLDELLRITTNSFDRKIHKVLETSIQNQLLAYQKAIDQQQELMLREMKELSDSLSKKKSSMQVDFDNLAEDIKKYYRQRLANNFTEIAWQYISEALSENIDLHSQKDAIFMKLNELQKQLKKDYYETDKVTK